MRIKEHVITEMLYEKCEKVICKGNTWTCRCPFCGDSRTKSNARRFCIDYYPEYDTYTYKCYRCGKSGNVFTLYSKLYDVSYDEANKKLKEKKYNPKSVKKILLSQSSEKESDTIKNELDIDLENECYTTDSIVNTRVGKNYIQRLKDFIDSRMIANMKFYIAHSGRYKGRIIIPVINDNKLEYFQGRAIYDDIDPKYLNPYVEKTPVIFNRNVIRKEKDIIIVEGLLDAMSVGNQCTSTLGADISDEKLDILFDMTDHTVIICTDNDEPGKDIIKKILEESKYAKILKYFIMPKRYDHIKDMNKLLTSKLVDNIEDFIINNSFSYFYMKTLFKTK